MSTILTESKTTVVSSADVDATMGIEFCVSSTDGDATMGIEQVASLVTLQVTVSATGAQRSAMLCDGVSRGAANSL